MKKQMIAALVSCSATILSAGGAEAQVDHYIGQIMLTAATFCPRDFAEADGRPMLISQNAALFSLLGVTYGGNGTANFNLPDLRGRAAIGSGNGPALSATVLGEQIGAESITLTPQQLPAHGVAVAATPEGGGSDQPQRFVLEAAGANVPIEIRSPALALKYCIAVNGIFPARPD